MGEQRERDVTGPGRPLPHLVLVQPHRPRSGLEAFLDRLADARHADQLRPRGLARAVGQPQD